MNDNFGNKLGKGTTGCRTLNRIFIVGGIL